MLGKRFRILDQEVTAGTAKDTLTILVDRETGVHYLWIKSESGAGGLTPLLDAEGKPVVTKK